MTIAFKTFGCRLNQAESLDLAARLAAAGHAIVALAASPDLILVRGCSVTARAQRDCEKEIARLRARHPSARVVAGGCLPNAADLSALLAPQPPIAPVPTATSRAYLKIQDGCSGACAFCIVPQFRGKPVSLPFDQILARARDFLSAGYRELVVTGCNLALYRESGHGLPDCLAALAELPSEGHRVRLGSLEPGICDDRILDVFAAHANICRFIHLSLQSGSDAVLRRMNRPYAVAAVEAFRAEARARLGPRLSLGADVIAGFPGETPHDHALTCQFLFPDPPRHPFANLHVFPYSERPGTPAATMAGALPRAVRRARARQIEALGRARRAAFAQSFVGQTVQVCVERDGLHGWTAEYLPCKLKGPARRRSLVEVVVDRVEDDVLFAR
ncbi:MAG: radical SAM protein [Kiritimatiellia bacterium]